MSKELDKSDEAFLEAVLKTEKDSIDLMNGINPDDIEYFSQEQSENFEIYIEKLSNIGFVNFDSKDIFGKFYFAITAKGKKYFEDKKQFEIQKRNEKIKDRIFEFIMVVVGAFLGALLSKYI